jgi:L-threonylcarbamoyladenylate synthase
MCPVSEPAGPDDDLDDLDDLDDESVAFEDEPDDESPDYQRFDCTDQSLSHTDAAEAARRAVEAGECIVLPTDTVYGIGADAFSPQAVQGLLNAKERGRDMPPPVLIGEASLIRALATDVPAQASELVARHWPGALTVIVKIQPSLTMDLGDAEGTIALRVPDHELAREVLRRTGPLAVSSANISGQPAALTCDDAIDQLGASVAVYLDGGTLGGGNSRPSTIVDFTRLDSGEVLRRGALSLEVLRETLPDLVDETTDDGPAEPVEPAADTLAEPLDGPLTSSGQDAAGSGQDAAGSGHEEAGSGHVEAGSGHELEH